MNGTHGIKNPIMVTGPMLIGRHVVKTKILATAHNDTFATSEGTKAEILAELREIVNMRQPTPRQYRLARMALRFARKAL